MRLSKITTESKTKLINKEKMFNFLNYTILIFVAFLSLFPVLIMIFGGFKLPGEIFSAEFHLFPETWTWTNFIDVFERSPFFKFTFNSLILSLIAILSQIFTCTLAAYAFAKLNFKGKKLIFTVFISSMMIPSEATIIPNYLLIQNLGLFNTYLGLAATSLVSVFNIFLMRQSFKTLPDVYFEQAKLDGAGLFSQLFKVALPLSKATIATIVLLTFVSSWNAYAWPFIITNTEDMRTLNVAMKYFVSPDAGPAWPQIMALSTLVSLPVIFIFLFFQKYFVSGLIGTGLK